RLFAGTVNLNGRLVMRVTAPGEETALAHIIAAVQRAQTSRADIQRPGDRASSARAAFALAPKNCFTLRTMNFLVQRSELRDLYDKVAAGERISEADALRLFQSKDLNALGAIADLARQKKAGNRAS